MYPVNLLIQRLPFLSLWQQQESCPLAPHLHRWTMWWQARQPAPLQVLLRQSDPVEPQLVPWHLRLPASSHLSKCLHRGYLQVHFIPFSQIFVSTNILQ
jgi:hypothetical protein